MVACKEYSLDVIGVMWSEDGDHRGKFPLYALAKVLAVRESTSKNESLRFPSVFGQRLSRLEK